VRKRVTTIALVSSPFLVPKERRVRCKGCGERFTVIRFERERTSAYCELCRAERKREQTRVRMQTLRTRRRKV
jgi:predicted nucleic acid-binding Zn ribbon protein